MTARAPWRRPPGAPFAFSDSQRERSSLGKVFVELDEITEGDRKLDRLTRVEGIDTQGVLQPRHDDGETERVETGLDELQLIRQRRESALLLDGDLLELRRDRGPHRHLF